jgi:hypothetical protein
MLLVLSIVAWRRGKGMLVREGGAIIVPRCCPGACVHDAQFAVREYGAPGAGDGLVD